MLTLLSACVDEYLKLHVPVIAPEIVCSAVVPSLNVTVTFTFWIV